MATYAKKDETVDSLLRRFKKETMRSGITAELRKREAYIAPSAKKRLKHEQALKRANKKKSY
jgi:small subunit ribosomal protein S21